VDCLIFFDTQLQDSIVDHFVFFQIQNRDAEKNEGKDPKKEAAKKEEKGEGDAKKDDKAAAASKDKDKKPQPAKKK
jgi:hypothetical protein